MNRFRFRTRGASEVPAGFAPNPPPAGYHWEFLTQNGDLVTQNTVPIVALVGN